MVEERIVKLIMSYELNRGSSALGRGLLMSMMRKVWLSLLLLSLFLMGCIQVYEYKYGVKYKVKVIKVVDGDTIYILFPDGTVEKVRLLGIDTPEKIAKANRPNEYDNITDLEYLAIWGKRATRFVESRLNNTYVYIEFDELAGFRDKYGRLLAYVYVNGTDFNAELVKLGYARVYVEGEFKKKSYYLKLEEEAKRFGKGIWSILYQTQLSIIIQNI